MQENGSCLEDALLIFLSLDVKFVQLVVSNVKMTSTKVL